MKINFSEMIKNLPIDPVFLQRAGGINKLLELFEKEAADCPLSNGELSMLYEARIFALMAYRKKHGKALFLTEKGSFS